MPLDDSDYHILGLRPHGGSREWDYIPRANAITAAMIEAAFGDAKKLNALFAELLSVLRVNRQEAYELVAKKFAIAARHETCINRRSRLYKLACRHVPVDIVAEKFIYMRVKVNPPKLYVHTKHTKLVAVHRAWPPVKSKHQLRDVAHDHPVLH